MLKKEYITIIEKRVQEILEELDYHDKVIRDDIFKLLRKKSLVLFYPLDEEQDLDGFHIVKFVKDRPTAFVYINSAKNFEKCIFCAAHELGHIYELEKDIEKEFSDAQLSMRDVDDIMNRFAAELLMPYKEFRDNFYRFLNKYCKDIKQLKLGDLLKVIVALMDYFYVPYKSVVRRLREIDFFTESGLNKFERIEKESPELINRYIYEGKYTRLRHPSRIKSFEDLPQYLDYAQADNIISQRKADEIREAFDIDLTLSDERLEKAKEDAILDTDIMKGNL